MRPAGSAHLQRPGPQLGFPDHLLLGSLQERAAMDLLATSASDEAVSPYHPAAHTPFLHWVPNGCNKSLLLPEGLLKPTGLFITS